MPLPERIKASVVLPANRRRAKEARRPECLEHDDERSQDHHRPHDHPQVG